MLNLAWACTKNTVGNITSRNTYITAEIKKDQGNGKYKVEIAGSDKEYPNVFTIETDPTYAVGDKVGILWEYGNREKPVVAGILRDITFIEVTGGVNSLGI
ncbi:hypothetical protein KAX02_00695 [candidate division WOR-3 bacterium]|nr:hypothetical protein [candidate division WOR-3 bacterium]